MLEFFRRHRGAFLIVLTIVIIITFSVWGGWRFDKTAQVAKALPSDHALTVYGKDYTNAEVGQMGRSLQFAMQHLSMIGRVIREELRIALAHGGVTLQLQVAFRILDAHVRCVAGDKGLDILRVVGRDHRLGDGQTVHGNGRAHRSHSPKTTSIAPRMAVASGSMWPFDIMSIACRCENAVGRILQRYGLLVPSLTR